LFFCVLSRKAPVFLPAGLLAAVLQQALFFDFWWDQLELRFLGGAVN